MRLDRKAILLGVAAALLLLGAAGAQLVRERPVTGDRETIRIYSGVSARGSVQEALDNAVDRAERDLPGADRLIRYRVREINGERGGLAGANRVWVEIEVSERAVTRPVDRPVERPAERPVEPAPAGELRGSLRIEPEQVRLGETVQFTLHVRNEGREPVEVRFPTGQVFDFEVMRDNRTVWRWSRGRAFTQALTTQRFEPGRTVSFRATWDLRDDAGRTVAPGTYRVRGFLAVATPATRAEATGTLTVIR